MIVNGTGRRYMNEAASYHSNGSTMVRLAATAATIPSWFIFFDTDPLRYALGPRSSMDFGEGPFPARQGQVGVEEVDTMAGLAAQMGAIPRSWTRR
ncbi:hypothetical protein AB5I41_14860 [Sphingomonas sp. MMS24-JH45]